VKNKKLILLLIILFPSAFWLILETSTINSNKLPFFGPKTLNGKDTVYYSLKEIVLPTVTNKNVERKLYDTVTFPLLALTFLKPKYVNENYRLDGLLDYTQYKKGDIDNIPLVLVFPENAFNLKDSLKITLPNIYQAFWKGSSYDSMNVSFFRQKPSHVDYSFIVLLDKKRRIRGYYDSRYAAEIKRLLGEYQHLRIKEEKNIMLQENEIKNEKHH
jgi:hypothetical protein